MGWRLWETTQLEGRSVDRNGSAGGCNLPETLVQYIMENNGICPPYSRFSFSLVDSRLVPGQPVGNLPKFSFGGHSIDNLRGDQARVEHAIRVEAHRAGRSQPIARASALRFAAAASILQNPLASRATRAAAVRALRAEPKVSHSADVIDPRGRDAELVTIPDGSHAGTVVFSGPDGSVEYDLTDSVGMRQELYYAPGTFHLLSRRTVLVSTALKELQDWLAAKGGERTLERIVYSPVRLRRNHRIRQTRVPCESIGEVSDGVCIQLGGRGGSHIVIGG